MNVFLIAFSHFLFFVANIFGALYEIVIAKKDKILARSTAKKEKGGKKQQE